MPTNFVPSMLADLTPVYASSIVFDSWGDARRYALQNLTDVKAFHLGWVHWPADQHDSGLNSQVKLFKADGLQHAIVSYTGGDGYRIVKWV